MSGERRDQVLALAAGGALLAAVLAPLRQHGRRQPRDGFPFSCYPMFTARRARHARVVHLLGVGEHGGRRTLHHRYLGAGGLNQVRRQLARSVREGRAQHVAILVATAVATSPRLGDGEVTQVRVVTGRYRYDTFFAGDRTPVSEQVHASAPVLRPAPIAELIAEDRQDQVAAVVPEVR